MQYDMDFVTSLLELFEKYDSQDSLWWRCGEKYGGGEYDTPASFFVTLSDTFYWGSADVEQITPENLPLLKRSFEDCKEFGGTVGVVYASELFACRVRRMRPQGAAYPEEKSLWPLFDAVAPERKMDAGNPKPPPSQRKPSGNSDPDPDRR